MTRKKVILLFGGRSVEHDISIRSATNVFQHMDRSRFEAILVGITPSGGWFQCQQPDQEIGSGSRVALHLDNGQFQFWNLSTNKKIDNIDAIFPVLHGTDGEDGSIQGLIKAAGLPCVGSGVLGSANSMDKLVTKRLLQQAGIPSAQFMHFDYSDRDRIDYDQIRARLGAPFIIKPVSLGSSVGVEKINSRDAFKQQIEKSFEFDNQILIEQFVVGREFEIGILGNELPESTVPGEVTLDPKYEFYSFDAKYIDPEAAKISIPAALNPETIAKAKDLAERSFTVLNCNDYARVDFFVTADNQVLINEINTIPGFTNISMFPKLWEYEGISYSDLITRIIELALERQVKQDRLRTDFQSALSRQ